jgi:aminoglycoside/choline kinase family phosphotransferase
MSESLSEYIKERSLDVRIIPLTPDASTREYYRLQENGSSTIACVYPEAFPLNESHPYVDVTTLFQDGGIRVPKILDVDSHLGIIRMEDVGDTILRERVQSANATERDSMLERAIEIISAIQATTPIAKQRNSIASRLSFDFEKLNWELEFFSEHYFGSLRRIPGGLGEVALKDLREVASKLSQRAANVVHRDFHSANIMIDQSGELVVIDHQDARMGSTSYDLVSLLLDRIEEVPSREFIDKWIKAFLDKRRLRSLPSISHDEFIAEFHLQSIQRCLKAIGTFSFQSAVRGKSGYDSYIRPMLRVTLSATEELGKFVGLQDLLKKELENQTL